MADITKIDVLADGSRQMYKFIGRDIYAPDSAKSANWELTLLLKAGEVLSDEVRSAHEDISSVPHPSGAGVIINIAGIRHGLPMDAAQALLDALTEAIAGAEKAAVAVKAVEAVDAAEVP